MIGGGLAFQGPVPGALVRITAHPHRELTAYPALSESLRHNESGLVTQRGCLEYKISCFQSGEAGSYELMKSGLSVLWHISQASTCSLVR